MIQGLRIFLSEERDGDNRDEKYEQTWNTWRKYSQYIDSDGLGDESFNAILLANCCKSFLAMNGISQQNRIQLT